MLPHTTAMCLFPWGVGDRPCENWYTTTTIWIKVTVLVPNTLTFLDHQKTTTCFDRSDRVCLIFPFQPLFMYCSGHTNMHASQFSGNWLKSEKTEKSSRYSVLTLLACDKLKTHFFFCTFIKSTTQLVSVQLHPTQDLSAYSVAHLTSALLITVFIRL